MKPKNEPKRSVRIKCGSVDSCEIKPTNEPKSNNKEIDREIADKYLM